MSLPAWLVAHLGHVIGAAVLVKVARCALVDIVNRAFVVRNILVEVLENNLMNVMLKVLVKSKVKIGERHIPL